MAEIQIISEFLTKKIIFDIYYVDFCHFPK